MPRESVIEKVIVKVLSLGLTKRFVVFLFLWLNCVFRTGQDKKNVWRTELDLILVVVIYRKCALQVWKTCGTGRGAKLHVFYIKWKKTKTKKKSPLGTNLFLKNPPAKNITLLTHLKDVFKSSSLDDVLCLLKIWQINSRWEHFSQNVRLVCVHTNVFSLLFTLQARSMQPVSGTAVSPNMIWPK